MKKHILLASLAIALTTHMASALTLKSITNIDLPNNKLNIIIDKNHTGPDCLKFDVKWIGNSGLDLELCKPYEVGGLFSGTLITIEAANLAPMDTLPGTPQHLDTFNIFLKRLGAFDSVQGFDGLSYQVLNERCVRFLYCERRNVPDGGMSLGMTAPILALLGWLGARRKA